jgi:hypothetical protein
MPVLVKIAEKTNSASHASPRQPEDHRDKIWQVVLALTALTAIIQHQYAR